MTIYLVRLGVHDGASETTLYLSTAGKHTRPTDTPPSVYFEPRVIDPGSSECDMFAEGTTRGKSSVGTGNIKFANGDPGNGETIDAWLGYVFDDHDVLIETIADVSVNVSSASTLFRGRADQLISTDAMGEFELAIYDRLSDLDKPLLTDTYAGTTVSSGATAEGDANLKDKLKPRLFGRGFNIPAILVNAYDLIYQVSDSAVTSITVFDGRSALTPGADYATLAALQGATVVAGTYATCLALGLFRIGFVPFKAITADATEGDPGERTAAQITERIMLAHGIDAGDILSADIAALDLQNDAECGIWVSGTTTALDACTDVMGSIGGWLAPNSLGQFAMGRLDAPTVSDDPVDTYNENDWLNTDGDKNGGLQRLALGEQGRGIASYRVTINYAKNYQVQGDGDVVGNVETADRTFVAEEWRSTAAEDTDVLTRHPRSPPIEIDTLLCNAADAETEADRKLVMHGVARDAYRFRIDISRQGAVAIGSVIMLQSLDARLGLADGKRFVVMGIAYSYLIGVVTLDVWG